MSTIDSPLTVHAFSAGYETHRRNSADFKVYFELNGVATANLDFIYGRGWNIFAVDPTTTIVIFQGTYDIYKDKHLAISNFESALNSIPIGAVVALAIKDTGDYSVNSLEGGKLVTALRSCGGTGRSVKFRASFAMVGIKGSPGSAMEQYNEDGYPVTASLSMIPQPSRAVPVPVPVTMICHRYWRLQTIDNQFEDRRWCVVKTELYDQQDNLLSGRMMAASALHKSTCGDCVDANGYVGESQGGLGVWGKYYTANYGGNDWFGVDLGEPGAAATRLVIRQYPRQHGSNHFTIQHSDDKVTWTTVATVQHPVSDREETCEYSWAPEAPAITSGFSQSCVAEAAEAEALQRVREQLVVVQQAGEEQAAAAAAEEEEEVAEEEASAAQQAEQEQYLHLADAFESGRPVPLPFEQVRAWTQGFSTEVRIGEGSFGEVFQGLVKLDARANANVDIDAGALWRRVAVKRLTTAHLNIPLAQSNATATPSIDPVEAARVRSRDAVSSLKREVAVLGSFQHPHIIRLVGYSLPSAQELAAGSGDQKLCLVYELAARGSLSDSLIDVHKATELTWPRRLCIAMQVAKALNHLHRSDPRQPAYHRDVKTSNIALMNDFCPKLIDCGLAKYIPDVEPGAGRQASLATRTGQRFGTPGYMCPHYARNVSMPFDAKCEVFSFGIVLLELMSGSLQGADVSSGVSVFLEDECEDIPADGRAGEWPVALVAQWRRLAAECTDRHPKRLRTMGAVMQRLVALNQEFAAVPTATEEQLLVQTAELRRELEAERLARDVQALLAAESSHDCLCCGDHFPLSQGILCARTVPDRQTAHFFCGGPETSGCFSHLVKSQAADTGSFRKHGSCIVCTQCKALQPAVLSKYPDAGIAQRSSELAFAGYLTAREDTARHMESCVAERQRREEREKHEDELYAVREQVLSDKRDRRRAACERHRRRITESVLNVGCPHCGLVFEAFNGCFAVDHVGLDESGMTTRLANSYCSRSFCGWCLAKFNDSHTCHEHVKNCPLSLHPGSYFGSFPADFNQVHGARRREQVHAYIAGQVQDEETRVDVRLAIEQDLAALDIVL